MMLQNSIIILMAISSRTFFHFTSKLEILTQILGEGFWPRYCREYGWGNQYDFAIPMVCFCDIPLTQIMEHSNFYGEFGIGISPAWIKSHKEITPVQYIALSSLEFNLVNRLITKLKNNEIDDTGRNKLLLAKKVIGTAFDKSKNLSTKKFYDEREWRYVPSSLPSEKLIIPIKGKEEFDFSEASLETQQMKLPISPEYISYLIIPSELYRAQIIDEIIKIYKNKVQPNILHILMSKIVSLKQIKEDF